MAKENPNNVLVTGSLSFIGYHIVSKIVQTDPTCKISVLDLPTSLPRLPSVQYHDVGICDKPSVLAAIKQIQPQVIFHAACTTAPTLCRCQPKHTSKSTCTELSTSSKQTIPCEQ